MSGMVRDLFVDNRRERLGVFGEWEGRIADRWHGQLGVRSDWIGAKAGRITRIMMGDAAAANAFNAADRSKADQNWDFTASAHYAAGAGTGYEFGFARKSRAPTLVERFLWKASNTYGQTDGRSYKGNLNLDSEVSHQVSVGADWHGTNWQVKPTLYYNHVSDYIQGVNDGTGTLVFTNLDHANLHGLDAAWRYNLSGEWGLDGVVSYVRGKTSGDNLYRMAPLHADIRLNYAAGRWGATGEAKLAARQDDVSKYNAEQATAGHAIVNLRGSYRFDHGFSVHGGIENLFDKFYADHLNGLNQVAGGSVGVNQRLPGAGRFLYLSGQFDL